MKKLSKSYSIIFSSLYIKNVSVSYCRLPAFCIFALLVSIDANETKNIDMSTINENNIKYTSSGERDIKRVGKNYRKKI